MFVLILSTILVWNISHSKKRWATGDQKCILVFIQSICYSCQIWMNFDFSGHTFDKYSNIKFHENPSSGSWVVPCNWTDRHTEMMKLIVTFCNSADVSKNGTIHTEYISELCRACWLVDVCSCLLVTDFLA
jgi:hypothetical protein